MSRLEVVARGGNVVGTIGAREGLRTNRGRITRITSGGAIYFEDGSRCNKPENLTVRHTDASRRSDYQRSV